MKRIIKVLFALVVVIVMLMGVLMIVQGGRERAFLPEAKNNFSLGIIGGADGPTAIIVTGPNGPISITDGGEDM